MQQASLFDNSSRYEPLAAKLRPAALSEYIGQSHLLGQGQMLRQLIEKDQVPSMIFWGPPGVGKTTLARIIAATTKSAFIDFSAVSSGIKEIRAVMNQAQENHQMGQKTILFIDEIHRFNKAQQDAFLPYVEKGSIILIGATTENPSFEINSALLSRCKVFVLNPLSVSELSELLKRAIMYLSNEHKIEIRYDEKYLSAISEFANGDARIALNTIEMITSNLPVKNGAIEIDEAIIEQALSRKFLLYDKDGEEHYNIISALHKSMRNSDVHAAIYWLARMLEGGEDPLYVARRIVRFASEDIGMADSNALTIAINAYQACHFIGMPECTVHLTHAVTYCALSPKSNALYTAYGQAAGDALNTMAEPVPLVIRNAPTKLMKELNYGEGYRYAHDFEDKITDMVCLPDSLKERTYYHPTNQGREEKVRQWMAHLEELRKKNFQK
ncbi:MAG: replication-associated recombination protein A [Erysipelotrichaceae bacterium]|nr:replication-associated recombination protein A [Erysipelotrichaceae bacterium]